MQQEVDFELFFLTVLTEAEELQPGERWIIPAESFMPQVLKHFGLSSPEFRRRFQVHAKHFVSLWKYSTRDRTLVLSKGKLVKGPTTYRVLTDNPEFIAIHGWISTKELNAMIQTKSHVKSIIPHKDLFSKIVDGEFKGKDLIRACNIDPDTNALCNKNDFELFKDRLYYEFSLDFDSNNEGYPNARTLYMQMHTLFGISSINTSTKGVLYYSSPARAAPKFGYEAVDIIGKKLWVPPYRPAKDRTWKPVTQFWVVIYESKGPIPITNSYSVVFSKQQRRDLGILTYHHRDKKKHLAFYEIFI